MGTQSAIVVPLYRLARIVSRAAYVLLACWPTVKEVVLRRRIVPALITDNPTNQERLLKWTATPGTYSLMYPFESVLYPICLIWTLSHDESTCKSREWECTNWQCDGTCAIYGEGHYITYDDKKFSFNGDCGYVFTQVSLVLNVWLLFFMLYWKCIVFWFYCHLGLLWGQQGWHFQGPDREHSVWTKWKHLLDCYQALLRGTTFCDKRLHVNYC